VWTADRDRDSYLKRLNQDLAPSCKYLRRLDGKFFVVDEDGFASKLCLCLLASSVTVLLRTIKIVEPFYLCL
jgi:hypothetical protein